MLNNKKIYWLTLFSAIIVGIAGGIFTARFSVDSVLASGTVIDKNPLTELGKAGSSSGVVKGGEPRDPRTIIFEVVRALMTFIGTILMIVIMYAGYLWWSARGNDEQVKKAKSTLLNAVIGLIILMGSYGLLIFIFRTVVTQAPKLDSDNLFGGGNQVFEQ